MHSVRLEPTKLIFIGTRTTYQAAGDAGLILCSAILRAVFLQDCSTEFSRDPPPEIQDRAF